MMCLGNDEPTLTYKQKRDIDRIVRTQMAAYLAKMPVDKVTIIDASPEVQALACEYATEVRDTAAHTMQVEVDFLMKG